MHSIDARALVPALRPRDARIPIHGHDLVPDTFRGGPNLAFLVCRAGGARRESIWASKSSEAMG